MIKILTSDITLLTLSAITAITFITVRPFAAFGRVTQVFQIVNPSVLIGNRILQIESLGTLSRVVVGSGWHPEIQSKNTCPYTEKIVANEPMVQVSVDRIGFPFYCGVAEVWIKPSSAEFVASSGLPIMRPIRQIRLMWEGEALKPHATWWASYDSISVRVLWFWFILNIAFWFCFYYIVLHFFAFLIQLL